MNPRTLAIAAVLALALMPTPATALYAKGTLLRDGGDPIFEAELPFEQLPEQFDACATLRSVASREFHLFATPCDLDGSGGPPGDGDLVERLMNPPPPELIEAWNIIEVGGGCAGHLSSTEFEGSIGQAKVETPLVSIELDLAEVEVSHTYYQVTCNVELEPKALGSGGVLRTVWLEQDGVKVDSCAYRGNWPQTNCKTPNGPKGTASTTPMTGSLEEGEIPAGVTACWIGPAISAANVGFPALDEVSGGLALGHDCSSVGIEWVANEDEALQAVADVLNDL